MSSKKENLFKSETQILESSEDLLKKESVSLEEYKTSFKELCFNYSDLLDQTRLITKVSDKLQNKLNSAYESLEHKNIELQSTIDELTKARVGRKAQTIILFIGLSLFILEEIVLEPIIDSIVQNNIWVSLVIKLVIAFLLKPLESFVESWLLKTTQKKAEAAAAAA
jgi:prefoldin subunit 5